MEPKLRSQAASLANIVHDNRVAQMLGLTTVIDRVLCEYDRVVKRRNEIDDEAFNYAEQVKDLEAELTRLRAEVEDWKETLIGVLEQACGDGSRSPEYDIDSFCISTYQDAIEKLGDCGALEVESGIGRNAFGRRPRKEATNGNDE